MHDTKTKETDYICIQVSECYQNVWQSQVVYLKH